MTIREPVPIGLVQMRCTPDPQENFQRAVSLVRDGAAKGAKIVCLPELFLTPYFCQTEDHAHFALAEAVPGPTTERLGRLAAELAVVVIASLFEKRAEGIYHNTAAVLDADGAYLGKYRKMHIPDDPQFYEKFYFTPGDLGFKVFATKYAKIGVLICWDQWYPEAARLTAMRGADVLFYPTAIGWLPAEKAEYGETQHESWELMQRSHAVANGCYVAAANRIGLEPSTWPTLPASDRKLAASATDAGGIEFWGRSFIAGPNGAVLQRAATDEEGVIVQPLDFSKLDFSRTHWPFFRDRRIDAYGEITRRYIDE
jgi:N-carbamoylputrescine amidase